ncbi:hypothetical protein [Methyloceanibacter sp.]|uniref:hypothetical protein n=1 Tax=Methyloceanibacter sp. TaxID=1965321 RepID=UPI003D6D0C94
MTRAVLMVVLALCALSASAAEQAQAPKDMVLLTVSGTIGESNRGALDPKKDSLLALQKADFKKAYAFDRAMLLGLEPGTVTAKTAELGAPATFKGPLLREVLGRIEAAKMKINFVAVNGFTGWLSPEDVDRSDWILALEADGVPLGIGQQGPLWLINTRAEGVKPGDDGRGRWVWAVFYMRVGE